MLDKKTSALPKQRVAISTRANYESNQVTFARWLFDNQEKYGHLLKNPVLTALKKHHDKNQLTFTKKGDISKQRALLWEAVHVLVKNIVAGDKKQFRCI